MILNRMKTAILIAAGGTGTRLWPLSTKKSPKQFVKLLGDKSLLRQTYERFLTDYSVEDIFISTSLRFKDLLRKEVPEIPEENIIYEPISMDTGPAICLATSYLMNKGYGKTVYISCDCQILKVEEFIRLIKIAVAVLEKYPDQIALIGLNPTFPAITLGYIEMSEPVDRIDGEVIFKVNSFKEKPDLETAKDFVDDWKYLWNASYFIFRNDEMLNQFERSANETLELINKALKYDFESIEFQENYSKTFKQAFDYMILEKTKDIIVLPANIGWSDVGTYRTIHELNKKDINGNYIEGRVITSDLKNSLVVNRTQKMLAIHGVENIIVVQTENSTLVTTIQNSDELKKLIEKLDGNDK